MLINHHTPPDQRKFKRHNLFYYLDVYDRTTHQFIGHLVDLSSEGAMLISKNFIALGTRIDLRAVLALGSSDQQEFDLQVEVVRSSRDANADYNNIGLHFTDVNPQKKAIIEYLIENIGF